MIYWGMEGKSVPRQERNGSERAKVANVAAGKAHPRKERPRREETRGQIMKWRRRISSLSWSSLIVPW